MKRLLLLVCAPLAAQQGIYFPEEKPDPWVPAWEFTLRNDRIAGLQGDPYSFQRTRGQLRLRWTWNWGPVEAVVSSWHGLGSDRNALNPDRYDNQPSNGTRLDLAQLRWSGSGEWAFGEVRAGLQENPVFTHESIWDKDLRVLGGGFRAGWKGQEAFQELGLRGIAGRVQTLQDRRVDLRALQLLLAVDTGPVGWTFHLSRWDLEWDPGEYRTRPAAGQDPHLRQRLRLDAGGGTVLWNGPLPVELRAIRQRNPDTGDDGTDTQLWIGSRRRTWWPQAGYIWQRFGRTGTLPAVNGDDWWWIANARGPRYEVALPLPSKWLLDAAYIRHRWYPGEQLVTRWNLSATKRF